MSLCKPVYTGFFYGEIMTIKSEKTYSFSNFMLEVAKGNIPGHERWVGFAHNESVGTSLFTIWWPATAYTFPPSASVMKVSSSSASDTSAGTGARTIEIEGLDANFAEITETVTLTGQTAVNTTNSFYRINEVEVLTAGSGKTNAGNIYVGTGTVTAGVPATIYGIAAAGYSHSFHGFYTVPANKKLYLHTLRVSSGTQKATEVRLIQNPNTGVDHTHWDTHFFQDGLEETFRPPIVFEEKSDLEMRAKVDAGTAPISVNGEGILVDYS